MVQYPGTGMDRPVRSPLVLLTQALAALLLSALLLLCLSWVKLEGGQAQGAARPEPLAMTGKSLQVVYGRGQVEGDALQLTAVDAGANGRIAIATQRTTFAAEDLPLLRYRLHAQPAGSQASLIWRLAEQPDTIKSMPLGDTTGRPAWLDVARNPDWHGEVVEVGVYVTADSAAQQVSITQLDLEPRSWRNVLRHHWYEWTGYRGWSARSINALYGTVATDSLSPVVAVAACAALAIALLAFAGLRGASNAGAVLAVLLAAWIALDLLWQQQLDAQLAVTRAQFAGKSMPEKHLADIDARIYRYIQRLRREVLPQQVARIVILHDSRGHNFERLKAQYYLLPHNSFNFGRVPPRAGLRNVDYILVLGDVPQVEFHADTGTLQWRQGQRSLSVQHVDSDAMGDLYRVLPPGAAAAEPTP